MPNRICLKNIAFTASDAPFQEITVAILITHVVFMTTRANGYAVFVDRDGCCDTAFSEIEARCDEEKLSGADFDTSR